MNPLADSIPPSPSPVLIMLREHATASSIGEACRDAWRIFMEQSADWTRAELVLWTRALYDPIAHQASYMPETAPMTNEAALLVNPRFVERMIEIARVKAYDVLTWFALPRARLEFGYNMREERSVTRCVDRFGAVAYLPTPTTDSLQARILALIAADVLSRPADFEGETLCSACNGIVLGPIPCCARYELRDTCVPSRPYETIPILRGLAR